MSNELRAQRVEALLEARPSVEREAVKLREARDASLGSSRAIARRLRPSGGLGKELREHPLQVVGLLVALVVLGIRWLTGSRKGRASGGSARDSSEGSGVVGAFAAGLAAAAAERGGRAVIDALLDPRSGSVRVDETGGSADDDQGRVAKR